MSTLRQFQRRSRQFSLVVGFPSMPSSWSDIWLLRLDPLRVLLDNSEKWWKFCYFCEPTPKYYCLRSVSKQHKITHLLVTSKGKPRIQRLVQSAVANQTSSPFAVAPTLLPEVGICKATSSRSCFMASILSRHAYRVFPILMVYWVDFHLYLGNTSNLCTKRNVGDWLKIYEVKEKTNMYVICTVYIQYNYCILYIYILYMEIK